ncbi:MAG TPA: hypothetical protein VGJ05_18925 [Fimbriiglobus sp.]|jgi:hypothetical protein
MTPFEQALLAIEITVDALHTTAKESPEAAHAVKEALDQIAYLGFDVRPTGDRAVKPAKSWAQGTRKKLRQQSLFP